MGSPGKGKIFGTMEMLRGPGNSGEVARKFHKAAFTSSSEKSGAGIWVPLWLLKTFISHKGGR